MKKDLFIILITTLFILILLYFYDKKEEILNKKYHNTKENIYIEYPYFHNQIIDSYINTYLNQHTKPNTQTTFIDYDYENTNNEEINLTMYIYEKEKQVTKITEKSFQIDLLNNSIKPTNLKKTEQNYDLYYQRIINKNKKMIALTFDDGPNYNTSKVLKILEKYNIKATFFILGCNIEGNEKIIKKMKEQEMEIGNHMYSHRLLTKLKNNEIKEEINKVDEKILKITNKKPTLIRPSYGIYNKRTLPLLDRPIIIWNIDTLDWKQHNSQKIAKTVLNKVTDGNIILMHDIYSATANSLNIIIPALLKKNYQFVTVSELLYYKEIEIKNGNIYSRA